MTCRPQSPDARTPAGLGSGLLGPG
jgi:hypothetical protein